MTAKPIHHETILKLAAQGRLDDFIQRTKQLMNEMHTHVPYEQREEYRNFWQELLKYANDIKSMDFDAQSIIEQAVGAAQPHPETLSHPAPDTTGELEIAAAEATHLHGILSELRERNIPTSTAEAEIAISGLHELTKRSARTAWQLGLHAVERGLISQAKLAELLDASTATVSRRYHQGLTEEEQQKIGRADARTLDL
jgi:hypothetical protein